MSYTFGPSGCLFTTKTRGRQAHYSAKCKRHFFGDPIDEVHETLIIAVFIDGSRSIMRVRFYQRSADQERDPRRRASFAFVGGAADRWPAKACAGSGH